MSFTMRCHPGVITRPIRPSPCLITALTRGSDMSYGVTMNTEDIARFWPKVDVRGPDECWPWIAGKGAGYGSFWLDGRNVTAHRVAFFLANGKWPDPFGCHSCDNHPCCNPAHIFEGTQWDNDMDRVAKGR